MNEVDDAARDHLPPLTKMVGVLALCLAVLMVVVDQFIVNVSVSTISGELGVSDNNGTWAITAYTVANAISIPLSGWLTKRFGWVKVLTASVCAFTFFSWMCGISWNLTMLISMRVLQGLAGGPLIPIGQALILYLMPKNKGLTMGIFGMIVMIGPALGPVLGGWITFNYGWRPIFYINIPVGILTVVLLLATLLPIESRKMKLPLDLVGLILFAVGIGAFQVMLDKGYDYDWFQSNIIIALAVISVVCVTFLVIWELYHDNPMLHLKQFCSGNFSWGTFLVCLAIGLCFANFIVGPLWVQANLGYSTEWAGFTLGPVGVTGIIAFPLTGLLLRKLDIRLWVLLSFICMFVAFYIQSQLVIWTSFGYIALTRYILGVGFAMFYVPLVTLSLGDIPVKELAHASSLFSSVRMIAIGAGVSLGTNYWYRTSNFFQSRYAELMIPSNPGFAPYMKILQQTLGLDQISADAFIYKLMINQAMTECFLQLCYISGLILIPASLALLLVRPVKEVVHHHHHHVHAHVD